MRFNFQFKRGTRGFFYRATGALILAVWLLMSAAEICPPLHAWLHGGSIPDDDDCAVVAIALGHVDSGIAEIPPVTPVHWIEIESRTEILAVVVLEKNLPPGRAPPAFLTVS